MDLADRGRGEQDDVDGAGDQPGQVIMVLLGAAPSEEVDGFADNPVRAVHGHHGGDAEREGRHNRGGVRPGLFGRMCVDDEAADDQQVGVREPVAPGVRGVQQP